MSNKCMNYVIEQSEARGSARLVLIMLADMANDDGECWPGKASLAKKCRMTPRTVLLALNKLETSGDIGIFRSRMGSLNRSNHYKIYMGGDDQGSSGVAISDRQGSDHRSSGVAISDRQGDDHRSPDPLFNPYLDPEDDPEGFPKPESQFQKDMRERLEARERRSRLQ